MRKLTKTRKTRLPKMQLRQCLSFIKNVWYLTVTRSLPPPPTCGLMGFSPIGFQILSISDPPARFCVKTIWYLIVTHSPPTPLLAVLWGFHLLGSTNCLFPIPPLNPARLTTLIRVRYRVPSRCFSFQPCL